MKKRDTKGKLISVTHAPVSPLLSQLVAGGVFLLGGVLTVYTLLITNANLGSAKTLDILSFGCSAGMILMVAGAFGMGVFRKDPRSHNGQNT